MSHQTPAPKGLIVLRDALAPATEHNLLQAIAQQPWDTTMARRVQHYGWRYVYTQRKIDPTGYLGPLPDFLHPMADSFKAETGCTADQAIVNEYTPGQGIAPHIDCVPCFGPAVAMIGLNADVQMNFQRGTDKYSLMFRRRDVVIATGPARYEWKHSIDRRTTDPLANAPRGTRISITLRSVNRP